MTDVARFGGLVILAVIAVFAAPSNARAQTVISGGTYTSNVTWTPSGSPYVLTGGLTIAQGATLTVQAGTVVKISGLIELTVNGQLSVVGTAESPVIFTSIQDDSDGVDSGGDGPTVGAPGQWYFIGINGAASYPSSFDYAEIRYGGWGSADNGYGAVKVTSGTVAITHSRLHHNQRSGVYVYGSSSEAVISKTRLDHNGNGASTIDGTLTIDNSVVDHNSDAGLYYSLSTQPPKQSVTLASRVADNGSVGVWMNVPSTVSGSRAPIAHRSNIFRNGTPDQSGAYPVQLYFAQFSSRTDITGRITTGVRGAQATQ
jgi:hypothetical protein